MGSRWAEPSEDTPVSRSADIRTQPIVNLVTMPRPADAPQGLDWNSIWGQAPRGTVAIGTVNGEQALIYTATEANTTSQNRIQFRMAPAGITIKPSTKYTLYVEMTSITTPKQIGTGFEFSNDTNRYQLFSSVASTSKQSFTREWTTPSVIGSTRNFWMFVSGSIAIGDQFAVHRVMLVEGSYSGVYSDGDTFNWKWQGTPYNSQSIGYPYTLESVAGQPTGMIEGASQSLALDGVLSLDPMTIYAVNEKLGETTTWSDCSGLNVSGTGFVDGLSNNTGMSLGYRGADPSRGFMHQRVGTTASNNYVSSPIEASLGKHIMIGQVGTGATQRRVALDSSSWGWSAAMTPGSGIRRYRLQSNSNTSYARQIATLMYVAEHDAATRARVMAWLANRYGMSLP